MSKVKVHDEKDGHFLVSFGDEKPWKMPHKAMSEHSIKAARMALGGRVKGYAEGSGHIAPEPAFSAANTPLAPTDPRFVGPMPEEMSVTEAPTRVDLLPRLGPVPKPTMDPADALGGFEVRRMSGAPPEAVEQRTGVAPALPMAPPKPLAPEPAVDGVNYSAPRDEAAAVTKAAPVVSEPGTSMPVKPGTGGAPRSGPSGLSEVDKGFKEQADAANKVAAIETQGALDMAEIQKQNEARRAAAVQKAQTDRADWQAQGDRIHSEIIDGTINPNRFFENSSTGQKIGGLVSMLFGAVGVAARGGGKNYGIELIDNAIKQDIANQADAIGEKRANQKNRIKWHMDKGQSLEVSQQLAMADQKDAAAAQISMQLTKIGGLKANPAAQAAIGKLRQEAAESREKIATMQAQRAAAYANAQESRAAAAAHGAKAAKDARGSAMEAGLIEGVKLSPQQVADLDPKLQARLVQTAPGVYVAARTEDAAKKVAEVQAAAGEVDSLVAQMRSMRKEHGPEILNRSVVKGGKSLTQQLALKLKEAAHLGALSGSDREMVEDIIANPTDFITDATFEESMNRISNGIRVGIQSTQNANLLRPKVAAFTGGATAADKAQN